MVVSRWQLPKGVALLYAYFVRLLTPQLFVPVKKVLDRDPHPQSSKGLPSVARRVEALLTQLYHVSDGLNLPLLNIPFYRCVPVMSLILKTVN